MAVVVAGRQVGATCTRSEVARAVVAVGVHVKVASPRDGASLEDALSRIRRGVRIEVAGLRVHASSAAAEVVATAGNRGAWVVVAGAVVHATRA